MTATETPTQPAATVTPVTETAVVVSDDPLAIESARFNFALSFGRAAASSQYFSDATSVSQAAVKIMAGYELGLTPVISLMHVNIIKGKVSLDGNLIATLLRKAGYSWKTIQHDENGAEFLFYKNGEAMTTLKRDGEGHLVDVPLTVAFTRKDAESADLTGPRGEEKPGQKPKEKGMYEKYPRNMYFNRVITNFQRWHAPEVSNGISVYTPEELQTIADGVDPDAGMPRRKEVA